MKKIISFIFAAVIVLFALLIAFKHDEFSVEMILSHSPENVFLASLFMLLLYAVKSISIVFPAIVLQMACGFMFSAPLALTINFLGALIEFTIPYFIGRFTGSEYAERKIQKNKRIAKFINSQKEHYFFVPFFLRVISVLPCDLVSMYLGAIRLPFLSFLTASLLGTFPGIIPATFMGKSITKPLSPEFLTAASITVICSLLSFLLFKLHQKES